MLEGRQGERFRGVKYSSTLIASMSVLSSLCSKSAERRSHQVCDNALSEIFAVLGRLLVPRTILLTQTDTSDSETAKPWATALPHA